MSNNGDLAKGFAGLIAFLTLGMAVLLQAR